MLMDFYSSSQGIPVRLVSGIPQMWRHWETVPRPRCWEARPTPPGHHLPYLVGMAGVVSWDSGLVKRTGLALAREESRKLQRFVVSAGTAEAGMGLGASGWAVSLALCCTGGNCNLTTVLTCPHAATCHSLLSFHLWTSKYTSNHHRVHSPHFSQNVVQFYAKVFKLYLFPALLLLLFSQICVYFHGWARLGR